MDIKAFFVLVVLSLVAPASLGENVNSKVDYLEKLLAKRQAEYEKAALDLLNDLSYQEKKKVKEPAEISIHKEHVESSSCPCDLHYKRVLNLKKVLWKNSYWRCVEYDNASAKCLAAEKIPSS